MTIAKKFIIFISMMFIMLSSFTVMGKEYTAKGTVNAIKSESKKLNISHGPVKGLMGAMKMDFKVADPAMLSEVSIGSTIKFTLDEDKKGNLTITDLEIIENSEKVMAE